MLVYVHAQSLSHVWLSAILWTVAHQAPLSMEFSRQECWSGLPFPPPGDLPNPGVEPTSPEAPALAGGFFTMEPLPPHKSWQLLVSHLDSFTSIFLSLILITKSCIWESKTAHKREMKISLWKEQTRPILSSVQFSHSVMSDSLWSHRLQHTRPLCPSPTPRVYSNSCPLSWWCHPTISSSVAPFPPTFNLSQHQGLFKWVNSLHQVAKVSLLS